MRVAKRESVLETREEKSFKNEGDADSKRDPKS